MLFSLSIMSNSLQPHGLHHARLPCPSLCPGICSNSCPLSQWCHPTISSSITPFSSCPWSFPASESFLMSQLFASGGQSIRASASVLPMNIQGFFPLELTGLISLLSKGLSRVFSSTTVQNIDINEPLINSTWRRKWQPTPVFLPGKSHGLRILVGYSPWGHKESDTTEQIHFTSFHFTNKQY